MLLQCQFTLKKTTKKSQLSN